MRKALITLLAVCLLLLGTATTAGADQPLRGTMSLQINVAALALGYDHPIWVGTVDFGDGDIRGMAFFHLGTGKPYDETGMPGTAVHFGEKWVIYQSPASFQSLGDPLFLTAGELPGDVLMWGYDAGVGNFFSNNQFRMNGTVEYVDPACTDYASLLGANVHMQGDILYYESGPLAGAPHYAPGSLHITRPHRSTANHQHQAF